MDKLFKRVTELESEIFLLANQAEDWLKAFLKSMGGSIDYQTACDKGASTINLMLYDPNIPDCPLTAQQVTRIFLVNGVVCLQTTDFDKVSLDLVEECNGSGSFGRYNVCHAVWCARDMFEPKNPVTIRELETSKISTIKMRYREIYDEGIGTYLCIGSEADYHKFDIKDDDPADEEFYGYIPEKEFTTLSDDELKDYVNKYLR